MNLNQFMVALLRADESSSSSSSSKRHRTHRQCREAGSGAAGRSNDDDDREQLSTAFHVFDANSDGFIDASELRSAMHDITGDTLTDADVDAMIYTADRDGDGRINYEGRLSYSLQSEVAMTMLFSASSHSFFCFSVCFFLC